MKYFGGFFDNSGHFLTFFNRFLHFFQNMGNLLDADFAEDAEGADTLLIEWRRPARGSGGPVRTYIIESRDLTIGQTPGEME